MCGKTDYTATLKVFRVRVLSVAKMDYEVGHGLLMAVNSQHNDISVKISDDCKVDRENPSPSRTRDCDSYSRKILVFVQLI